MNKLYHEYVNCLFPRVGRAVPKLKPSFAIITWPNGKPCSFVNFWLSDLSSSTTGQTVKQYCVNITPLIRYCYDFKVDIIDFSDADLNKLVGVVAKERRSNGERQKQNNQVNAVIDAIILFYVWLRDVGSPRDFKQAIGDIAQSPNITVKSVKARFGRIGYEHESHLAPSTDLHSKHPMPQSSISAIEDQIFMESDPDYYPGVARHKFRPSSGAVNAFQKYLFERRSFTVWMFRRTGLRPDELCSMPLSDNLNVLKSKLLYIPTRKRRTDGLTLRPFKISSDAALTVCHYLSAREEYVQSLVAAGCANSIGGVILLTEDGNGLSAASLTRDFSRVVKRAGLSDVRACLSMFRHRFITREILLHLKEVFSDKQPTRALLSPPVIKSLEERIRKKTGHGLGVSIWTYFDSALDMINLWKDVDRAILNLGQLEDIEDKMQRLKYDIRDSSAGNIALTEQLQALQKEVSAMQAKLALGR